MAEQITCNITKAISKTCKNRQGGISKLYLFPYVKHSKSLNLTIDQEVVTFPFTNAFLYEAQNIAFTESTSIQNGGIEWTQKLDFTIPEADENSEVYRLANKDYSAVILDRNGKYRFIGMRNGGEVTVNSVSGTLRGEMNGYSVSITAKEDNQAYYIPDFETIFNVVIPSVYAAPGNPTGLIANNYDGGLSVNVSWNASVEGTFPIEGYYIYVNEDYYSTVNVGTVALISGLTYNTDYEIKVESYDVDDNKSGFSNELNIKTDVEVREIEDGSGVLIEDGNGNIIITNI